MNMPKQKLFYKMIMIKLRIHSQGLYVEMRGLHALFALALRPV